MKAGVFVALHLSVESVKHVFYEKSQNYFSTKDLVPVLGRGGSNPLGRIWKPRSAKFGWFPLIWLSLL
jgi:hypothetical protein